MQVTKITSPDGPSLPVGHRLSDKQLYDEVDYHRARKLTKKIMEMWFISSEECDKINSDQGWRQKYRCDV